jgi:hypothetical protein
VTDTATNFEWLKPSYTAGQTFDNVAVQQIRSSYGFRYATEAEVLSMISDNFGALPTSYPGTPAGYTAVQAFFAVFGVNQNVTCGVDPCPRTQGVTSTVSVQPNRHNAVGVIAIGANGYLIQANEWLDNLSDAQTGSWLVRESATVPEPATLALSGLALGLLAAVRSRALTR